MRKCPTGGHAQIIGAYEWLDRFEEIEEMDVASCHSTSMAVEWQAKQRHCVAARFEA